MPYLSNIRSYILARKVASAIALAVLLCVCWYAWGKAHSVSAAPRYAVGEVSLGTVVATVSASGQISATNQVDLKPKASGDITYVGIKAGQQVAKGQLLVRLDSGDAAYELESAQLSYEKLVTVDPEDLRDAQAAVSDATDDQASSYVSARADLTKSAADMQDVLDGLGALYESSGYLSMQSMTMSPTEKDYRNRGHNAWYDGSDALAAFAADYRSLAADAPQAQVDALLAQASQASASVAQAAKYAQDAVAYLRDRENEPSSAADSAYSSVTGLAATSNGTVSSLSSAQSSISTAARSLQKAQEALDDLQAGPDELDRRSQALSVSQKQEALADYSVYAPFAGVVASVDASVGDSASSGTALATLITQSQIAEVSLNEVDAARVKVGQKATLTFDAIDGLSLTGTVASVDAIGTVSQGVVSYSVEISLDSQDERIKPGMTVSASIQTDVAQNVLVVPSSAVKTAQGRSYVLAFATPVATSSASAAGITSSAAPVQIPVEVGISDDTSVEITSGLSEGQQIITRTITAAASGATAGTAATRAAGTTGTRAGGFGGGGAPAGAVLRAF